nr:MAG TPA: hypothetical protein [Caudoviricetes sp.]
MRPKKLSLTKVLTKIGLAAGISTRWVKRISIKAMLRLVRADFTPASIR